MRISFEIETPRLDLAQKYKNVVCHFRGHNYKPYKDFYGDSLYSAWFFWPKREVSKECSRCGKYTYKKNKAEKGQTITWRRFSKIKATKKMTKKEFKKAKKTLENGQVN